MSGKLFARKSYKTSQYKILATSSNCGNILNLMILILISYNSLNIKINSQHWIILLSKVQRLNVDGLFILLNNLRYSLVSVCETEYKRWVDFLTL